MRSVLHTSVRQVEIASGFTWVLFDTECKPAGIGRTLVKMKALMKHPQLPSTSSNQHEGFKLGNG